MAILALLGPANICAAQATSLQNVVFKMSDAPGTQHQGLYIESGKCIRSCKDATGAAHVDGIVATRNTRSNT